MTTPIAADPAARDSDEPHVMPSDGHVTVLLNEAVDALLPASGGVFVDATFGGGGHTGRLLDLAPAHRG